MDVVDLLEMQTVARQVLPETVLWSAIIGQVMIDAFEASDSMLADFKTWKLKGDNDFDAEAIRAEARRWLVSDLKPWKDDREDACDLAGFDPDAIRLMARKRLGEARAEEELAHEEGREPNRCSTTSAIASLT